MGDVETTLAPVTRTAVNGFDAIVFEGVNVHVRNGSGQTDCSSTGTDACNGVGNLLIGYDDPRTSGSNKNGSHNLVIGPEHNFSRYGSLVMGTRATVGVEEVEILANAFVLDAVNEVTLSTDGTLSMNGDTSVLSSLGRLELDAGTLLRVDAFDLSLNGTQDVEIGAGLELNLNGGVSADLRAPFTTLTAGGVMDINGAPIQLN